MDDNYMPISALQACMGFLNGTVAFTDMTNEVTDIQDLASML